MSAFSMQPMPATASAQASTSSTAGSTGVPVQGTCYVGDTVVPGIGAASEAGSTLINIVGSLLSVTGDAELIQVTSLSADEFTGEVTAIVIDGTVDCGGICGGGGTVDGNAEIGAGGYIEMTDVNMDAVNLAIENTDGEWSSTLGDGLQEVSIVNCGNGDGLGATDLGAILAANNTDTAIGKGSSADGLLGGATAVGASSNASGSQATAIGASASAGYNSTAVGF